MTHQIIGKPDNLEPEIWDLILEVLKDSTHLSTLERLRELNNEPQSADSLFTGKFVNELGQAQINATFRLRELPFRLTRIGTHGGDRSRRLLAIVPWPPSQKAKNG